MNCPQCGAQLVPNSGFCGACGTRLMPQQGNPAQSPPPMHGHPQHGQLPHAQQPPYPQQPYPQQGQVPQQPYPQQGQMPQQPYPQQGQMPQQPYPGQQQPYPNQQPPMHGQQPYPNQQPPMHGQQPYPNQPQPQGGPPLRPFPIVMQQRFTRLTGQMFLAPTRLFFICESKKGAIASAIGQSVGGLVGAAISVLGTPTPGQSAVLDEPTLFRAVQELPGSLVMEPGQIKAIKDTMWTRGIFFNGKTYALPAGLDRQLSYELALWANANRVTNAGLRTKP